MTDLTEQKCTIRIYKLIFILLLVGPFASGLAINSQISRFFELACFFYLIYTLYKMCSVGKVYRYSAGISILILLLGLISLSIICRGNWNLAFKDMLLVILGKTGLWAYLLPFVILALPNRKYFPEIIRVFYKASLFVVPLWLLNVRELVQYTYHAESIGRYLPFISALLLGLGHYFDKKERIVNVVLWLTFLFLMLINARRNVSFSLMLYALIAYGITVMSDFKKNAVKRVLTLSLFVLLALFVLLNMDNLAHGVFKEMGGRIDDNSRYWVEYFFFQDFDNSPANDWIWGRGMDGGYYQIEKHDNGEVTDTRTCIETGYLNMILKGGLSYVVIIMLFMLSAIPKAFNARRIHGQSFLGVVLISFFVDLYTTNPVCEFSVRSITFWFIVSFLLQKTNINILIHKC